MARKTSYRRIVSDELLSKINPLNKKLAKEFFRYLKSINRSEGTIRGYRYDLNEFFVYLLNECDNKSIIDCNIRDFVNYQGYLLEDNVNSPARIRRLKASLSSFSNAIELLYADEYPNFRNLIRKIESPVNEPVREKTVLTQKQIDKLLTTFVDNGEYEKACCFALAAYSGRRKAELFRFRVSDFSDDKIVFDTLYKSDPILTKGRGGGKKINCYTLAKQFKPYFDLWMKERERLGIKSDWLFPDQYDMTIHRNPKIMDSWSRKASKILGTDVYPHAFRHNFVSYLAAAGLPNSVIVAIMSWSTSSGDAMVSIYNDADISKDLGKYFSNGEIIAPKETSITEL